MKISQPSRILHPPASPLNWPSTFVADQSSSSALGPTSCSRRILHPPALPSDQPPIFIGDQSSRLALEPTSDSHRILHPPAVALELTFDFRRRSIFRLCPRINFRLTARSSVEETVGVPSLCMQVQIFRFLWISSDGPFGLTDCGPYPHFSPGSIVPTQSSCYSPAGMMFRFRFTGNAIFIPLTVPGLNRYWLTAASMF
jgi:hypothetical protein